MKNLLTATMAIALAFAIASPGFAAGKKTGFGNQTDTSATQGSGGQTNDDANPENEGQTIITEETTGPRGQLKQGSTDCQTCETTTTVDLPGKNR
jgi:hypothetical protein